MKRKHTFCFGIGIVLLTSLFSGCYKLSSDHSASEETNQMQSIGLTEGKEETGSKVEDTQSAVKYLSNQGLSMQAEDYYEEYKETEVNYIQLNESSILFSGEGAFVSDNKIKISKPGTYVVFGKLKNGQIIVEDTSEGVVRLVLKEANIHSDIGAPIYVKEAGKAVISLVAGTKNTLSENSAEETRLEKEGTDAVIYSTSDLTLNGTGSLSIHATSQNAITSQRILRITEGNYEVHAAGHGLVGKDAVVIETASMKITSECDGIRTNHNGEDTKGIIFIERGEFEITAQQDGIQADKSLIIRDGSYRIQTGGGNTKLLESVKPVENPELEEFITMTENDNKDSRKGLKSGAEILIKRGTFEIDSAEDAIHGGGNISIENGMFQIASGDDAIHADGSLTVAMAEVNVTSSYEGLEGLQIQIKSGNYQIISKADGIRTAGGTDNEAENENTEKDTFLDGEGSFMISGGTVYIKADGDGIDIHGTASMTGGTLVIEGPTNQANAAIDYDSTFEMNGGTLLAIGSSGLAKAPSETSMQNTIFIQLETVVEKNTLLCLLEGEEKNPILTYLPGKSYQSIVFSSPLLTKGKRITVSNGGVTVPDHAEGLYTPRVYEEGNELVTVEVTNVVTTYGKGKTPDKMPEENKKSTGY